MKTHIRLPVAFRSINIQRILVVIQKIAISMCNQVDHMFLQPNSFNTLLFCFSAAKSTAEYFDLRASTNDLRTAYDHPIRLCKDLLGASFTSSSSFLNNGIIMLGQEANQENYEWIP